MHTPNVYSLHIAVQRAAAGMCPTTEHAFKAWTPSKAEVSKQRGRRTHAVVVVLADEQDRQVPQRRDVERLEDLPLVRRSVAVPASRGLSRDDLNALGITTAFADNDGM